MPSKRWAWPTAVAILFAGLTNAHAHVHYCFDGQEPPAAVHLTDGTDHAHEHPAASGHDDHATHNEHDEHDDLDLDVPNQALAKAVKHDLPAIAPAFSWTVAIDTMPSLALARSADLPPAPDPPYAHPQLRAPPA